MRNRIVPGALLLASNASRSWPGPNLVQVLDKLERGVS
jgi:hypothetical protein